MIRTVLFDLDDTLFDHRGCARDALVAVRQAQTCFQSLPFDAFERAHPACREELRAGGMLGRVPVDHARIERFRRLLEAAGLNDRGEPAAELAPLYREPYRNRRRSSA